MPARARTEKQSVVPEEAACSTAGEEVDPKVVKWLLEAIHKIKGQKQRPSDEHICRVMESQHGYSWTDTQTHLEQAVKAGFVLKVLSGLVLQS